MPRKPVWPWCRLSLALRTLLAHGDAAAARAVRVCERDPILLLDDRLFVPVTAAPAVTPTPIVVAADSAPRAVSGGAIAAIVVALVVVVGLVAFAVVHRVRERRAVTDV